MPKKASTELNAKAVERLLREAGEAYREVADGGCPGLALRLHRSSSAWYLRMRNGGPQMRIRLGAAPDVTLAQARHLSGEVRRHVEAGHGIPDSAWIELTRKAHAQRAAQKRGADDDGERVAVPQFMPKRTVPETWTYAEARAAYHAHLQAECDARIMRQATVRNYVGIIGCPALRTLDATFVSRIRPQDIAQAIKGLTAEGKRNQAKDVARNVKRFWNWLSEAGQVDQSGAAKDLMKDLRAPKLGDVKSQQHFPFVSEVGIMLAVAQHGVLADAPGFAIELLIYTAQRRLSVVKARIEEFIPWPEREGWGIWWEGHRKVNRGRGTERDPFAGSHAIPLPPYVWTRAQAYIRRTTEDATAAGKPRSPWMFPIVRPRRAGSRTDWHFSEDTLTHVVGSIPMCRATPHDVRRAFSSHLQEEAGISSNLVGLVMDHARSDLLHAVDDDGMTRRYTRDEMLKMKAKPMTAWIEALIVARRVTLPDSITLKTMLVAENLRQRGVKDPAAEKARRAAASAKAYAEGRTSRQRKRTSQATVA